MTREEALKLNYPDSDTVKLMCNYSELNTCGSCTHEENNECEMFGINVSEDFTCLSFGGEEDGI